MLDGHYYYYDVGRVESSHNNFNQHHDASVALPFLDSSSATAATTTQQPKRITTQQQGQNPPTSTTTMTATTTTTRPTIYTYMDDESNNDLMLPEHSRSLIQLWQDEWRAAGWNPVVLTSASCRNTTPPLVKLLHDSSMRFHHGLNKWRALSCQAIMVQQQQQEHASSSSSLSSSSFSSSNTLLWYADWDVFPLQLSSRQQQPYEQRDALIREANERLQRDTTTTLPTQLLLLLERVAPSLAVGTADAWIAATQALLQEAVESSPQHRQPPPYWTDTLALLDWLWPPPPLPSQSNNDGHGPSPPPVPHLLVWNKVLSLDRIPVEFVLPDDPKKTNATTIRPPLWCTQRWLGPKYAIHVSARHLATWAQTDLYRRVFVVFGSNDNDAKVLPHHRVEVARALLSYLRRTCAHKSLSEQ